MAAKSKALRAEESVLTSLTLHGPNASILKVEPVFHCVPFACALGEADLVIRIVAVDKIFHNTSRLEEVDSLAISEGICERRNSSIGVNFQELSLVSLERSSRRQIRLTHSSFCVFLEMSILWTV